MNIQLTLDRVEGEQAVLKSENGESIHWPTAKLPEGAREGGVYVFNILDADKAKQNKEETARAILNELLNTEG